MLCVWCVVCDDDEVVMLDRDRPQACVVQRGVLQLACAVVQAMEGDIDKSWDRLATVEKVRHVHVHVDVDVHVA